MGVIRGVMTAMASSARLILGGFGTLISEWCCVREGRLYPSRRRLCFLCYSFFPLVSLS